MVISIIALLIGLLLPALGAARNAARQLANSTQTRGIHQGFVTFAQSNKGLFPGLKSARGSVPVDVFVNNTPLDILIDNYQNGGAYIGAEPSARFMIMLNGNFFTPDYLISPGETRADMEVWTPALGNVNNNGEVVATGNPYYSYALSQLSSGTANLASDINRRLEWSDTLNSEAVAISDRLLLAPGVLNAVPTTHQSIWGDEPGDWGGSVTWNDNHVEYLNDSTVARSKYAKQPENIDDQLYANFEYTDVTQRASNAKMAVRQLSMSQLAAP